MTSLLRLARPLLRARPEMRKSSRASVEVPRELDAVTSFGAGEVFPPRAGLAVEDVEAVWNAVQDLYRSRAYPALGFCLRRRGQVVLNRALGRVRVRGPGEAQDAPQELLTTESPVCLFSASKAVTAMLVHKLAEEGGVDLDVRVSHYLPEFAAAGKAAITVANVLSHRGGFPTIALPREERRVEVLEDWDRVIRLICAAPQTHGNAQAYHAITGGFILAEIIQRVTGASIRDYLDASFRQPLGMTHFTYGLREADRPGVAVNYCAGQKVRFPVSTLIERALLAPFDVVVEASNSQTFMDAVIPAGNIYATADELSRFYQMLLDGGVWQGRRILKAETVARAVRPADGFSVDRMLMIPMRYSEGMMLGADSVGLYGPDTGQAFGHIGFINIMGWADPKRELAVALLTTGKAILGGHLLPLTRLLGAICKRCL